MPDDFRSKDSSKGARWEVRWKIDCTGRCRLFRYRADAEAFMAEIEDGTRSNRYTDPKDSCRPLSGVADLWQQGLTGTVKGSAEGRYRLELRYWILPKRREDALKDITTVRIRHWYVELAEGTAPYAGKWDSGFLLSASSIRSAGRNVLGALSWMRRWRTDGWRLTPWPWPWPRSRPKCCTTESSNRGYTWPRRRSKPSRSRWT